MKIRMVAGMAGRDFSLSPGDETDRFSVAEAKRLIEAGFAVPVRQTTVEKAVKEPPETADKPATSKRKTKRKG